jgi:hypothetical protein
MRFSRKGIGGSNPLVSAQAFPSEYSYYIGFILFVINNFENVATKDEVVNIDNFNEKLRNQGYWIAAEGISHPSEELN